MNTVGINTSTFANAVTPFSPVGKQAVGLENAEAKGEAFSPIEEPPAAAAAFNREADDTASEEQRIEERREQQQQRQEQQLDQQKIRALAARDREVHAHEQAHASVGGRHAGSPTFTFERGPDGVNYAVGGEVSISLPAGGDDPVATLAAAEQVRRAALAPANPSSQDRSVAAAAGQLAVESRAGISELQAQEQAASSEQAEADRVEAQQQQDNKQQQQLEGRAREERLAELRQSAHRSSQLGEQLVTSDNVEREQSVGRGLDQLA